VLQDEARDAEPLQPFHLSIRWVPTGVMRKSRAQRHMCGASGAPGRCVALSLLLNALIAVLNLNLDVRISRTLPGGMRMQS
jgi:hypothetical protein